MLVTSVRFGKEIIIKVGNKTIKIKAFQRNADSQYVCIGIDAPDEFLISTPGRRRKNLIKNNEVIA